MTRSRSQMTLDAWDEGQAQLGDAVADADDSASAPTPRTLDEDTTSAVALAARSVDDDTIPAVAPRGALDVLRALEAAA